MQLVNVTGGEPRPNGELGDVYCSSRLMRRVHREPYTCSMKRRRHYDSRVAPSYGYCNARLPIPLYEILCAYLPLLTLDKRDDSLLTRKKERKRDYLLRRTRRATYTPYLNKKIEKKECVIKKEATL